MALVTSDILITDRFSIFRTKFNELLDEFGDFVFDPYSGALSFENDFEITGTLDVAGNVVLDADLTVDGEAYYDGTFLNLNWGNSSIVSGGLRVDRGSAGADAVLQFVEADDLWKVGLYGGTFTALSLVGHTHDDRYYTESEIDANIYTQSQVDTLLADYLQIESSITGTPKVFIHQGEVADDGTFDLPAITNNGFGWICLGNNSERSLFFIDEDGTVTLVSNSVNVVANEDTDNKLCIGSDAYEPTHVKNRMGTALNINLCLWYN